MQQDNEFKATLVSSEHGFDDFDVEGIPTAHRVTIGHGIRKGDVFNVHCDQDRKIGAVWQGTLEKSLEHLARRLAASSAEVQHEFAFDCTLTAAIRVKAATRAEAESQLRARMDAADCNGGAWPSGDPILFEASINDSPLALFEIDGEGVENISRTTWESNDVQFPRLLAEIMATQDGLDLPGLAQAMDLTLAEVNSLFERAHEAWETHKRNTGRRCLPD